MAYFSVILNGEGISVESESGDEPATGFYTTRWVEASDSDHAIKLAKALVSHDWVEGEYSRLNRGATPTLRVDDVWELNRFRFWLRRKPRGHTFYTSE
jgi:hypothetical protein